jgi:hypothetical protein
MSFAQKYMYLTKIVTVPIELRLWIIIDISD